MRRSRLAAAVLACVLSGAMLSACGDARNADVGAVVLAAKQAVDGETGWVQLPTGQLEVTVSEPHELIGDEVAAKDDAPPSGLFVAVGWQFHPGKGVPAELAALMMAPTGSEPAATVALQVGRLSAKVGDAYGTNGASGDVLTKLVRLPEGTSTEDIHVQVVFDGVPQTLTPATGDRDEGAAAGLYSMESGFAQVPCQVSLSPKTVSGRPSCRMEAAWLPYASGLGWAAQSGNGPGRWLAVHAVTDLVQPARSGNALAILRQEGAPTVAGGAAQLEVRDAKVSEVGWESLSIYRATADRPPIALVRTVRFVDGTSATLNVSGTW